VTETWCCPFQALLENYADVIDTQRNLEFFTVSYRYLIQVSSKRVRLDQAAVIPSSLISKRATVGFGFARF
jgi:hypothetical protein